MPRIARLAGSYFGIQAAGILGWWTLLFLRPEYRAHFQIDPGSEASLLAFLPPDLLLAAGSLAASLLCFRRSRLLTPMLWLVAGGVTYATLYCLAGSLLTGSGWLGFLLMAPAMLLSTVFAAALSPESRHLFRRARPGSPRWNLAKTAAQIALFWSVLLFLVPAFLSDLQAWIGLNRLAPPAHEPVGAALFLGFSALGLWSGATMSRLGLGTPLPLDAPRRLVVEGPYAFVRNPMAVAGLGQGIAVAVYTSSLLVLAYVLLGTLVWQYVVRPLEEEDLRSHFGDPYEQYQREVRCWLPVRRPFIPGEPTRYEDLGTFVPPSP